MPPVRRLSDFLINKIAAGEVVERPASVVKELAENAVDAQAREVRVRLTGGGLSSITIIDDGVGMNATDAALAMERHATSKLPDDEALFAILTKGFRGEALPSIASVSRFTLTTAVANASEATRISIQGGGQAEFSVAPPVKGTRIDVEDLFFNVPARRKFLKRESTELAHCEEALLRLALAHPEVAFHLEHDGKPRFSSPAQAATPKERVVSVLGAEVDPHLLAIEEHRLGIDVWGFICSPEYTQPTARGLYTFVNHRYIRDRGLTSAIQRAYQDQLAPGRQPVAVVHIQVDPRAVDVNVHPQKLEVRFADPRGVQEAVGAAISRALKAAPWRTDAQGAMPVAPDYAMAVERFLARAQPTSSFHEPTPELDLTGVPLRPSYGTARPQLNDAPPPGYFGSLRFIGELARRLWVMEAPGGSLVLIDPQAVSRRTVLDALALRFRDGSLAAADATLFSATFNLPAALRSTFETHQLSLNRVGIELESFGGDSILVRRVPAELETADLVALLTALADCLPPSDAEAAAFVPVLDLMAEHASQQNLNSPTHDEVRRRLARLDEVDFQRAASRAKVVVHEVALLALLPT